MDAKISKETIIADLKRVATLLGKNSLMAKEYAQHGQFSLGTVLNTFGGKPTLKWSGCLRNFSNISYYSNFSGQQPALPATGERKDQKRKLSKIRTISSKSKVS